MFSSLTSVTVFRAHADHTDLQLLQGHSLVPEVSCIQRVQDLQCTSHTMAQDWRHNRRAPGAQEHYHINVGIYEDMSHDFREYTGSHFSRATLQRLSLINTGTGALSLSFLEFENHNLAGRLDFYSKKILSKLDIPRSEARLTDLNLFVPSIGRCRGV